MGARKPKKPTQVMHWKDEPDEHDYLAAREFLCLIVDTDVAKRTVRKLRTASLKRYKAKDLMRASNSKLLPFDDTHVAVDLVKVDRGIKLSPELFVVKTLEAESNAKRPAPRPSLFDQARDLCGSIVGGPPDLARNPRHMKGYGGWKR